MMLRPKTPLLRALVTIVLMAVSNLAYAGCSSYIGRVAINEVFKLSASGPNTRFIEIKVLDTNLDAALLDTWELSVCADQKSGKTITTHCETVGFDLANDTNPPWYSFDGSLLGADVFDLQAMDVLLTDGNGDAIDYLSIGGYTEQATSCNWLYPATASIGKSDNPFQVYRSPDGIGAFDKTQGSSGSETPQDDNDGATGSATLEINDVTVSAGDPAQFTITLSEMPAAGSVSVDFTLFASATSTAGIDYVDTSGTLTFSGTTLSQTIDVTTLGGGGGTLSALAISPNTFNASTCFPASVTLTATMSGGGGDKEFFVVLSNATNARITKQIGVGTIQSSGGAYTGDIQLSTSTTHGNWATIGSGTLAPDPDSDDNGAATYSFHADDNNSVTLLLDNAHAETLQITANDGGSVTTTSGDYAFLDNAFVITPITCTGATCPGTGSTEIVAGRDHQFAVTMWRRDRDDATNLCAIATGYNAASQNLKASIVRDGDDPGGAAPEIGGASLPSPPSTPATTDITLDFSPNPPTKPDGGTATFTLRTTDVGKYSIQLRDESGAFALPAILGSSETLTVRPFGLSLTAKTQDDSITNPQGTAAAGNKFIAADEPFKVSVTAHRWQAVDDAIDNDGVPDAGADLADNDTTAAFAWQTELSESTAAGAYTPAEPAGAPILAGPTNVAAGDYTAATATAAGFRYPEVGSFTLQAAVNNYLNSAGVDLSGGTLIGRFVPDHFTVIPDPVTGAIAQPCTTFTYMDQAFIAFNVTVEARNVNDVRTTLYDETIGYAFTTPHTIVAEDNNSGLNLYTRFVDLPVTDWVGGQWLVTSASAKFARTVGADGPYQNLAIGLRMEERDGLNLAPLDMNAATSTICSDPAIDNCDAQSIGTIDARWGRVTLANAFGPEILPLDVPVTVEYWDSALGGFLNNSDDSCTSLATIELDFTPYPPPGDHLDAGETNYAAPPVTIAGGVGAINLSAPGAGNEGSVDVRVARPVHLLWDGLSGTNPKATATFGLYRGPDSLIYQRERY